MKRMKQYVDLTPLLKEKTVLWDEALGYCDCVLVEDMLKATAITVPPVSIGEEAYFIINGGIYRAEICLIDYCQRKDSIQTEIRGAVSDSCTVSARFSDWGTTVFATRREAEEVLFPCDGCLSGTYRSCRGCSHNPKKSEDEADG